MRPDNLSIIDQKLFRYGHRLTLTGGELQNSVPMVYRFKSRSSGRNTPSWHVTQCSSTSRTFASCGHRKLPIPFTAFSLLLCFWKHPFRGPRNIFANPPSRPVGGSATRSINHRTRYSPFGDRLLELQSGSIMYCFFPHGSHDMSCSGSKMARLPTCIAAFIYACNCGPSVRHGIDRSVP